MIPSAEQLAWQQMQVGTFFHFGPNTFAGLEWSDGTLSPAIVDPTELDADEWVATARATGARYVVLTAKHHDGFCNWPTATTDYSIASAPWRGGRGDIVGEVAAACERAGLRFGLYLSPWDRHEPRYADPVAYSEFYATQLTELCTRYGDLAEIWFDGAGSEGYRYDWPRIVEVIETHQPGAMVFNMGRPTIRWVGNEDGLASDPCEYLVGSTSFSQYTTESIDLVDALYLPPECDVSIRRGWFHDAADQPKSVDHLLGIHYRSVGLGANLLLNIPPDRRGRIDPADDAAARGYGSEIARRFRRPVPARLEAEGGTVRAVFDSPVRLDHLELREDLGRGQRITGHRILVDGRLRHQGHTVGSQRLHVGEQITTSEVVVELAGEGAALASLTAYDTGVTTAEQVPQDYRAPTVAPD